MFEGYAVFCDQKGYPCIWFGGKSVKVHLILWERINGPRPKGYVVHHRDFDKGNYALVNLELLSESDHRRIHAGWVRRDGEWAEKPCTGCGAMLPLGAYYQRKGYTPAPRCKPCCGVYIAAGIKSWKEDMLNA